MKEHDLLRRLDCFQQKLDARQKDLTRMSGHCTICDCLHDLVADGCSSTAANCSLVDWVTAYAER